MLINQGEVKKRALKHKDTRSEGKLHSRGSAQSTSIHSFEPRSFEPD